MKVLITGSSSGIGRALWSHLIASGANVWGLARSNQNAMMESLPQESRQRAIVSQCDVTQEKALLDVAVRVRETWGTVNAVICAAGTQGQIGAGMEVECDQWWETIRVNLLGTYATLRAFFPMLASGSGKVICFSGGGATAARPRFSAYACSKVAVVRLVETLAEEWKGSGVYINAIAPGAILSQMTEQVIDMGPSMAGQSEWEQACQTRDSGAGAMKQVCGLVDYLLSKQSDGISGRLISARWDPWERLHEFKGELQSSDVYCLRRIVPEDRGKVWGAV